MEHVREIGTIKLRGQAFKFNRFGSIYDLAGQGEVKMHIIAPRLFRSIDSRAHSFPLERLNNALCFVSNRLPTSIHYSSFFTRPIGRRHAGLYHMLSTRRVAQHLLESASYSIDMSDVFFLPVGVMAPLSNPDHQHLLGLHDTTPNKSSFHENYFNKLIPRPLCVRTGPKTRRGSHAWILMCFLDKAPTPDSMSLLTEISAWHVRLPGDICANCGILVTANYRHRCDNHCANDRLSNKMKEDLRRRSTTNRTGMATA
jgi:hypothetical protein